MGTTRSARRALATLLLATALTATAPPGGAAAATGWSWPAEGTRDVLLGYGETYAAGDGATHTHHGLDIACEGEVVACSAGTVSFCGTVPGGAGGRVAAVTVKTSDGLKVTLMPLEGVRVRLGQEVAAGDVVADGVTDGDASSPEAHLHVGVRRGESYLDPTAFFAPVAPAAERPAEEPVPDGAAEQAAGVPAAHAPVQAPVGAATAGSPSGVPAGGTAAHASARTSGSGAAARPSSMASSASRAAGGSAASHVAEGRTSASGAAPVVPVSAGAAAIRRVGAGSAAVPPGSAGPALPRVDLHALGHRVAASWHALGRLAVVPFAALIASACLWAVLRRAAQVVGEAVPEPAVVPARVE